MSVIAQDTNNLPDQDLTKSQPIDNELSDSFVNLNTSPPDFNIAQLHGLTKKVYKPPTVPVDENNTKIGCPCCKLPPPGDSFKLSESLKSLNSYKYLRSGYILYFEFLKYSICILLLIFITSGLFNMITNLHAGDCADNVEADVFCTEDYITIFSMANKKEHGDLNRVQAIICIITVIFIMAFFHYIRLQYRKIVSIEDIEMTPSDFTIRVDGLSSKMTDNDILNKMKDLGPELEVRAIFRTYKVGEYIQNVKEFEDIKKKLKKNKDDKELQARYQQWDNKLKKIESKPLEYGGTAFIMFNTSDQSDIARLKLNKIPLIDRIRLFLTQGKIRICQRAPEPNEVLWENIGIPSKQKNAMKVVSFVLTVLLIGGAFGIIIGLNLLQYNVIDRFGKESFMTQLISAVISVSIIVLNLLLEEFFVKLSKFQKTSTYLAYFEQFITRLTFAQFVNTALVNIFVKLALSTTGTVDFYGTSGLIPNIYYMFIITSFLTPALDLFNPGYFIKLAQQKLELKKGENSQLTQKQANRLFEGPDFGIVRRYVAILKLTFLTCFYCQALPLANLYILIGLTFKYFVEKYIFTQRIVLPAPMGYRLNEGITELSEWNVFLFAIGNLIFSYAVDKSDGTKAFGDYQYLLWIALIISVVNIFLPMEEINRALFKVDNGAVELPLDQVIHKFKTKYEIENPVTRVFELEKIRLIKSGQDPRSVDSSRLDLQYKSLYMYALHEAIDMFKGVEDNEPPKPPADVEKLLKFLFKRKENQAITGIFGATITKSKAFQEAHDERSFDRAKTEGLILKTKPELENSLDKLVTVNDIKLETKAPEQTIEYSESFSHQEGKLKPKDRSRTKSSLSQQASIKPNSFSLGPPKEEEEQVLSLRQDTLVQDIFSDENYEKCIKTIKKEDIGKEDYYLQMNPVIMFKLWQTWDDEERDIGKDTERNDINPDTTEN